MCSRARSRDDDDDDDDDDEDFVARDEKTRSYYSGDGVFVSSESVALINSYIKRIHSRNFVSGGLLHRAIRHTLRVIAQSLLT